jgi:hypothetical protein
MFRALVHRPQATFLRKAVFQVHVWAGLALGLYAFVIDHVVEPGREPGYTP